MKLNILGSSRKNTWPGQVEEAAAPRLEVGELKVETILVAVDFSEGSRRALEFAEGLAREFEAEIVLLHVFEGVPGELKILEATHVDTSFREQARKDLADWEKELRSRGDGIRSVFREGTALDREIVAVAIENRADLIVLGRHGRGNFISTNTVKKVLARAPCPVLVGG